MNLEFSHLCHLPGLPLQEVPVNNVPEDHIDHEPDEPQEDHVHDNAIHPVQVVVEPEILAKPRIRDTEKFRCNQAHPGNSGRDPDPRHHGRESRGKRDVPDQVAVLRAAEHLARFDKDPRHAPEAGVRIYEDGKDCPHKDDEPGRDGGEPEPDDSKRDPGKRGDRPQEFDEGIEEGIDLPVPTDRDPDRNADNQRQPEADGKMDHAHLEILQENSLLEQFQKRGGDIERCGEQETVLHDQRRIAFPERECQHDRKSAEPPVLMLP